VHSQRGRWLRRACRPSASRPAPACLASRSSPASCTFSSASQYMCNRLDNFLIAVSECVLICVYRLGCSENCALCSTQYVLPLFITQNIASTAPFAWHCRSSLNTRYAASLSFANVGAFAYMAGLVTAALTAASYTYLRSYFIILRPDRILRKVLNRYANE
jgi:hypothetical protein